MMIDNGNIATWPCRRSHQVGAVEGEEEGAGAQDEEEGEVEHSGLPGHHHATAAVELERKSPQFTKCKLYLSVKVITK